MNNILFVHNVLNNKAPKAFNNFFKFQHQHDHDTVRNPNSVYSIPKGSLELPKTNLLVGKKSIRYACSDTWNSTLKELARIYPLLSSNENWLKDLTIPQLKKLMKKHFLDTY